MTAATVLTTTLPALRLATVFPARLLVALLVGRLPAIGMLRSAIVLRARATVITLALAAVVTTVRLARMLAVGVPTVVARFARTGIVTGEFLAGFSGHRGGILLPERFLARVMLGVVALMITRVVVAAPVLAATTILVSVGMGGAIIVVTGKGAFFGLGLGIRIFRALGLGVGGLVLAATLVGALLVLAATLLMAIVKVATATAATTTATTPAAATATTTMPAIGIITTAALGRSVAATLAVLALLPLLALLDTLGGRAAALFLIGGNFSGKILVFILVVEVIHARRRGVGRAGGARRGDGFRLAGEMLARGQLHIASGEAGQLSGAHEAGCLARRGRADDDLGDDVARAGAEKSLHRVSHEFGIDGALRVERHRSLGRGFRIGPGVNGGGADAVAAKLVKEGFGEMVQTAFDGRGDRTAGGGTITIPAKDDEVALLFAQPRERDAGEGDGREEADVEALGHVGDRSVEQRRGGAPGGVDDEAYVPFACDDILGHLGEGGGVGKVAGDGEKIVVREGIARELGGECIYPAAHADQAPGDGEPRPGVGAGD